MVSHDNRQQRSFFGVGLKHSHMVKVLRRGNVKLQTRRRRHRLFVRGLSVLGLVIGLTVGLRYLSFHLEKLKVQSVFVEVEGGGISGEEILSRMDDLIGSPILSVSLKEIVMRLTEDPRIDRVKVVRQLPHTLKVEVTPHEPGLILSAGKFYYIGTSGKIFKEVARPNDSMDYPILTGLSREEMEQDPPRAREILQQALTLVSRFESQDAAKTLGLSEIHYDRAGGFSIFPEKKPFRIIVGFDDFETKLKRLTVAMEKLKSSNHSFASIDLNYEGKVILTM